VGISVAVSNAATASTVAVRDGNAKLVANAFVSSETSTATAGGTTTLTIASAQTQVFTGSTTQTVKLPTTNVIAGQCYTIINQSSGAVTVQSSGGNTITALSTNQMGTFTAVIDTPVTAANWYNVALTGVTRAAGTSTSVAALAYLNAKDFGAALDGTTDDTAALNAMIAAANSGSTKCMLLTGTAKVTGPLTAFGDHVILESRGGCIKVDSTYSSSTAVITLAGQFSEVRGNLQAAGGCASLPDFIYVAPTAICSNVDGLNTVLFTGGWLVHSECGVAGGGGGVSNAPNGLTISNIRAVNINYGIYLHGHPGVPDNDFQTFLSNLNIQVANIGDCLLIEDCNDVQMSKMNAAVSGTNTGVACIRVRGLCSGIFIQNIDIGIYPATLLAGVSPVIIVEANTNGYPQNIKFDHGIVQAGMNNILVTDGDRLEFRSLHSRTSGQSAVKITGGHRIALTDLGFEYSNAQNGTYYDVEVTSTTVDVRCRRLRHFGPQGSIANAVPYAYGLPSTNSVYVSAAEFFGGFGMGSYFNNAPQDPYIPSGGAAAVPLKVQLAPGQTGNAFEVRDSAFGLLCGVTAGGAIAPSGIYRRTLAKTGSYTFGGNDDHVVFTITGAATATLPSASTMPNKRYVITNATASTALLTLASAGGTIPLTSLPINTSVEVASDGTNWQYASGGPDAPGSATPTASTLTQWDANVNLSANNLIEGFTSTPTAAGTTTLTVGSGAIQVFTGTTTQTVTLPTTSVVAGQVYRIVNNSTGAVTVQSSGANTILILAASTAGLFTALVATPTAATDWVGRYWATIPASGKSLTVSNTLTLAGTDATTMTFPTSSDTVVGTAATQTLSGKTLTSPVINGTPTGTGVDTAATASTLALRDSNANVLANAFIPGFATTVTAAATTTLVVGSKQSQIFTGTTTQTVVLPTTGVVAGQQFTISSQATGGGNLTVNSSASNLVAFVSNGVSAVFTALVSTPTTAGQWSVQYISNSRPSAGPTASTAAIRDGNANLLVNAVLVNGASTVTAAGTTTLVVGSAKKQVFTGSTTQTVTLPTTSVVAYQDWEIINTSSGALTINSSGANLVKTLAAGASTTVTALQATPTTAAHWFAS
jgi:hypothetical protein